MYHIFLYIIELLCFLLLVYIVYEKIYQLQCTPWKTRACCTEEVTRKIHEDSLYSFNFNHCMHQTRKEMSPECHRHFKQDHCFYECSPNIGPFVVSVSCLFLFLFFIYEKNMIANVRIAFTVHLVIIFIIQ